MARPCLLTALACSIIAGVVGFAASGETRSASAPVWLGYMRNVPWFLAGLDDSAAVARVAEWLYRSAADCDEGTLDVVTNEAMDAFSDEPEKVVKELWDTADPGALEANALAGFSAADVGSLRAQCHVVMDDAFRAVVGAVLERTEGDSSGAMNILGRDILPFVRTLTALGPSARLFVYASLVEGGRALLQPGAADLAAADELLVGSDVLDDAGVGGSDDELEYDPELAGLHGGGGTSGSGGPTSEDLAAAAAAAGAAAARGNLDAAMFLAEEYLFGARAGVGLRVDNLAAVGLHNASDAAAVLARAAGRGATAAAVTLGLLHLARVRGAVGGAGVDGDHYFSSDADVYRMFEAIARDAEQDHFFPAIALGYKHFAGLDGGIVDVAAAATYYHTAAQFMVDDQVCVRALAHACRCRVCVCACLCLSVRLCMSVCMCVCVVLGAFLVCVCTCLFVRVRACVSLCVSVFVFVSLCVSVFVFVLCVCVSVSVRLRTRADHARVCPGGTIRLYMPLLAAIAVKATGATSPRRTSAAKRSLCEFFCYRGVTASFWKAVQERSL